MDIVVYIVNLVSLRVSFTFHRLDVYLLEHVLFLFG